MTGITAPLQVLDPGILPILPPNQTPGLVDAPPQAPQQAAPQAPPQAPSGSAQPVIPPDWLPPQQSQQAPQTPPQAPPQAPQAGPLLPPQQTPGLVDNGTWDTPQAPQQGPASASPSGAAARLAQAQALTGGTGGSPPASQQSTPSASPSSGSQGTSSGTASFSDLPAIPQPFQQTMQQAAKQYGVPLPVLQWTIGHESGFSPGAVNKISGATGIAQFMPQTAKQRGVNPTDPVSSINGAASYLSDLYQQTGNWADAVAKYGTFSPTVGSQDQPRRQGFVTAMQNAGVPNAGTSGNGGSQGSQGARLQQAQSLLGNGNSDSGDADSDRFASYMNSPMMQQMASLMRPTPSQQMAALASGLLSGPTFGMGLGKGLANLNQLSQQNRESQMQRANIGMQGMYRDALLGYRGVAAGQKQEQIDQGNTRLGQNQSKINFQQSPTAQAAVAGAKASATTGAKDNAEDIDSMIEGGQAAPGRQETLNQIQQALPQAGTGSGMRALRRDVANFLGVDMSNSDQLDQQQYVQSLESQVRGSGIMGKNMRTQREFNTVFEGLLNPNMDPATGQKVLNSRQNINQFQTQLYNEWGQLSPDQQKQMRADPDAYNSWYRAQSNDFFARVDKQGGLYASPNASAGSRTNASAAGQQPQATLRFDPATGKVVPITN
jgi:hypothetical protein